MASRCWLDLPPLLRRLRRQCWQTQSGQRIEARTDATIGGGSPDFSVTLGIHSVGTTAGTIEVPHNEMTSITQEVISPFAGRFVLRAKLRGEADSREAYESILQKHFTCRLAFLQFNSQKKNALETRPLATIDVTPEFHSPNETKDLWTTFELSKNFISPQPGSNFSFGSGLAVSIQLVKTSPGSLKLQGLDLRSAFIRIAEVSLEFVGKERDPNVKV